MRRRLFICIMIFVIAIPVFAQDMRFSQFYAAPIHSNPGFTGTTIEHRFVLNYRNQWPSIPGGFQSFHASYEYNSSALNSGFGLIMAREDAGTFGLTTNLLAFSYAYRFRLNRKTYLMPGIKFGYAFRSIDFSKLVFNDQLESNSAVTLDVDAFEEDEVNYPDISGGLLLYSENYWVGAALNHINEPNQTFLDEENVVAELPMRFTFQSGYKFKLSGPISGRISPKSLMVAMHYESQGKFDQLDLGFYFNQAPLVFGLWYRGLPGIKSTENVVNNDALILLLGYSIPDRNLRLGYSYDITISRLATNTAGAHELSLIYEFASQKEKRKSRRFIVPCAKF